MPEGYQQEWLYAFDIELPAGRTPVNQDGEVAAFRCLPVAEAAAIAAGETMTVDAALVTLDFLLRQRCLPQGEGEATQMGEAMAALRIASLT
jgi:hypothetical protein